MEASPDLEEEDPGEIAEWIAALPLAEKDKMLERVASGEGGHVQALLLRRFRESTSGQPAAAGAPARTAKELRDATAAYKAEIARAVEEHKRAELVKREAEKAAAYAKRLDDLSAGLP